MNPSPPDPLSHAVRVDTGHRGERGKRVYAVVVAAGMSSRMSSQMKVLLPWGEGERVIERVVKTLKAAPVDPIFVIVGHRAAEVTAALKPHDVTTVTNPDYATGEMLSSFKTGIHAAPDDADAVLMVLGDQPRMRVETVRHLVAAYQEGKGSIVAPSWNMRRGHPILIDRVHWAEILDLPPDAAPRDVVNRHEIFYVTVDDDSILGDVDTPEQYAEQREKAGLPPL